MPDGKPNVLIILCDDPGWSNASCYHQGVMASPTPNIDRVVAESVRLTDCYAQASCTAGRAADTFTEFPPRQAPANFNPQEMLDSVLHAAAAGIGSK